MIKDTLNNISFEGISIDSRTLAPKNLYFALNGEQFDGHDYVLDAIQKGAGGVVVSNNVESPIAIHVKDAVKALGEVTSKWRDRFSIPVVGLTGSNGKTTTKNMIAAILKESGKPVLATKGNLNNHIGVPLTLALLDESHDYAVIEMGMNHTGEISYLTQLVHPTIALINNVGPTHLEGVGNTLEGVAKAKGEIFEGLSEGGTAIINNDDAFADYWKAKIKKLNKKINIVTFGIRSPADVTAAILPSNSFKLNNTTTIQLKLWGNHNIYNALAAATVGVVNQISLDKIKQALENLLPEKGRMELKKAGNQMDIIDDSYNANPQSLKAAIESIGKLNQYRQKILILGDMRELGVQAENLHAECGKFAKENGIDVLWATGDLMRNTVKNFGENARHFESKAELIENLINNKSLLDKNNLILVKGSRSMEMEQVVKALVSL
jgi:UDP-N-acetylmuramoyl-tripeptide--D-alanyl-D-alanine ligase